MLNPEKRTPLCSIDAAAAAATVVVFAFVKGKIYGGEFFCLRLADLILGLVCDQHQFSSSNSIEVGVKFAKCYNTVFNYIFLHFFH